MEYKRDTVTLYNANCLDKMAEMESCSVDSIVTDPPYGLKFMGKDWDHGTPGQHFWEAALRVAKPGAMMLAFGGTRTFHRLTCAIEDAGWEIRDCLMWLYGSGFPKSMDISKAIDKSKGAERAVVGSKVGLPGYSLKHQGAGGVLSGRADGSLDNSEGECAITTPSTALAKQWQGFGTALKPAWEPIILAMKPLDGTFANSAEKHGVAGLNIDACRINTSEVITNHARSAIAAISKGKYGDSTEQETHQTHGQMVGRWPANLLLDEEAARLLDEQTGVAPAKKGRKGTRGGNGFRFFDDAKSAGETGIWPADAGGGASRFFYCAKTSKTDRNEGCGLNNHPTVKPTDLMRYLCRLVTPPEGIVLDPFMGSGSTGKAAVLEGFGFTGIELEESSFQIAIQRIDHSITKYTADHPLFKTT